LRNSLSDLAPPPCTRTTTTTSLHHHHLLSAPACRADQTATHHLPPALSATTAQEAPALAHVSATASLVAVIASSSTVVAHDADTPMTLHLVVLRVKRKNTFPQHPVARESLSAAEYLLIWEKAVIERRSFVPAISLCKNINAPTSVGLVPDAPTRSRIRGTEVRWLY